MTINALICDDEKHCCEIVLQYLQKYCEERNFTFFYDLYDNGKDAILSEKTYNIAFLDIEINNISG